MDMLKESRLAEWAIDVKEWKDSTLTQKQWCEMKGIKLSTFRHRIRALNRRISAGTKESAENLPLVNQSSCPEPIFAKVNLTPEREKTSDTGIKIKLQHTEITVYPDANSEHLRLVLEALSYA